jgi:hypothetical protein
VATFKDGYCLGPGSGFGSGFGSGNLVCNSWDVLVSLLVAFAAADWISRWGIKPSGSPNLRRRSASCLIFLALLIAKLVSLNFLALKAGP